jgi:hypothetical protein
LKKKTTGKTQKKKRRETKKIWEKKNNIEK